MGANCIVASGESSAIDEAQSWCNQRASTRYANRSVHGFPLHGLRSSNRSFPEEQTPQPLELYQAIYELSHLIRTVARQYWIGFAMANEGSVVQATRTRIESGIATFFGQGSFSAPIIVSALTEDSWRFLGLLLSLP